jgi:hypothetical protein
MTLKEYLETKRNADGSYWIDPRLVDEGSPFPYNCEGGGEMIYVGEGGELACLDEECFQKNLKESPDNDFEWVETFNITGDSDYGEPYYSNHDIEESDMWLRRIFMSKEERIAEIDEEIKRLQEEKLSINKE